MKGEIMDDLSVNDFEIEEHEELKESFRIIDDAGAVWAMRKLAVQNEQLQINQQIAETEKARIDQWLEKVNTKPQQSADYFTAILTDYARNQRAESGRKSIQLPHGVVKSRITNSKIKVEDVELFIKWAETNNLGDLVRIKKEPAVSDFKTVFEISGDKAVHVATGEIVEGVVIAPESINFSVETE
jgi:phage host-nuclease inhibitor protein Gam